jgi:hypothetical protein
MGRALPRSYGERVTQEHRVLRVHARHVISISLLPQISTDPMAGMTAYMRTVLRPLVLASVTPSRVLRQPTPSRSTSGVASDGDCWFRDGSRATFEHAGDLAPYGVVWLRTYARGAPLRARRLLDGHVRLHTANPQGCARAQSAFAQHTS